MDDSKVCTTCNADKPLADFGKNSARKDGRQGRCRSCVAATNRRRYLRQGEEIRRRSREYKRDRRANESAAEREVRLAAKRVDEAARRARNPEEISEARLAWAIANPEKVKTARRKTRAKNRDRFLAREKAWREANPELLSTLRRQDYERHREAYLARTKAWIADNPERAAANAAAARLRRLGRIRATSVAVVDIEVLWTGSCAICGLGIPIVVKHPHPLSKSLDHIVALATGGGHTQDNLQWTHLRCNIAKGVRPA